MSNSIFELETRACDALVTGFSPEHPIYTHEGKSFYIPSASRVCEFLGNSLGKICGKKRKFSSRANPDWEALTLPGSLSERVLDGLKKATALDAESDSILSFYLDFENPRLEQHYLRGLGDLYRYRKGERERAIERATGFWSTEEMTSFAKIHTAMRRETLKSMK